MRKRNETEAARLEHKPTPKATRLKEVALGDNGEMSGNHMVARPQHGQKLLGRIGTPDDFVRTY